MTSAPSLRLDSDSKPTSTSDMANSTPSMQINTKRANIAKGAMLTAGKKVAEKITSVLSPQTSASDADESMEIRLETMNQSFPTHTAQHTEFITALTGETVKLLNHSFEHAWTTLSTMGSFSQFIPLANALDRIEAEAEARLGDGAEPNVFTSSTDLSLTFPAQTLPLLSAELEHQRGLREQLRIATDEKATRVLKRFQETQEKTRRIQAVFSVLDQCERELDQVDMNKLHSIQNELQERIPTL